MSYVAAILQWLWAPLVALGVSALYFRNARNSKKSERVAVSIHGAVLALLYFSAWAIDRFGAARPSLGWPFWILLLVPASLVLLSLVRFQGNKNIHFLQLANLLAGSWVFFIGTMAVTGNWL